MAPSGWAWLPKNLLDSILDNLIPISDCVRFSAVCTAWRCAALENFLQTRKNQRPDLIHRRQLPLLLLPSHQNPCLYSLIHEKLYQIQFPLPLPTTRFCGSSHGWLIMVDTTLEVILLNPFSLKTHRFPPLSLERMHQKLSPYFEDDPEYEHNLEEEDNPPELSKHEYFIRKGVLSADPALYPDDFVLMVIYGLWGRLVFIRSGDEDWTYVDRDSCSFEDDSPGDEPWHWFRNHNQLEKGFAFLSKELSDFTDIIYHNGQFYAVHKFGELVSCSLTSWPKVKKLTRAENYLNPGGVLKRYLVQSSRGDLLWVSRFIENFTTTDFQIYKMVEEHHTSKVSLRWVEERNMGDMSLFVGDNHSICVVASENPGCQPKSIYFTDDYLEDHCFIESNTLNAWDWGVFNLLDGSIHSYYKGEASRQGMSHPIWMVPTFM